MHEVPFAERTFLPLDDQQRLAREHEEVLLIGLPVVYRPIRRELSLLGVPSGDRICVQTGGSFLFSVVRDGAFVHVAMRSLLDAPTIRPTEHIFVGSKAAWFEITDNPPQFDEYAI